MNKFTGFIQVTILLLLTGTASFAQKPGKPSDADIATALKGGRVILETTKLLMEPNDFTTLSLHLMVYAAVNGETLEQEGEPYEIDLPGEDPNFPAPYHEGTWKIIKGGGKLLRINSSHYNYTAPAVAPPDNSMVISVDLNPTSNRWPKLVLLQTLYFVTNETAIVVKLPEGGFNNQKYVSKAGSGVKMPTVEGIDPAVLAHMDANMRAKMAQAAVEAAQKEKGINVAALTSNAMAYYDSTNDVTTVKLTQFSLEMENGKDVRKTASPVNVIFEFSYKGKGKGNHPMNDKISGAGFLVPGSKGCGCGNNKNGQDDQAPCNGFVNIKSIDDKVMKGEIWASVYTVGNKRLVKGSLHGKFTANLGNKQ